MTFSPDIAASAPVLRSLTGLRWAAAFVVFGFHIIAVQYFGSGRDVLSALFGAGGTGVSMFFILSGFVLTWTYRPGTNPFLFWRRRFARIWPTHVVAVGVALVAAATLIPVIRSPEPASVVANIFLVSSWRSSWWQAGNPVSWSLVCEAFFYLLFPLLIRMLTRVPARWLWVVGAEMILCVWLAPLVAPSIPGDVSAYSTPVMRLPEFVVGIVVALLVRQQKWRGPRLAVALPIALISYTVASASDDSPWAATGYTVIGYALLIAALARADIEGVPTPLSSALLVRLGTLSFSFYLIHLLVIASISSPWPDGHPQIDPLDATGLALVAFAVALGAAWVLHRFVERPAHRLLAGGGGERPGGGMGAGSASASASASRQARGASASA
ncbi:acyltransferase family protein [Herbiconiux solani]|uniref:acyltransferase family protein n=1 Tax=Herbiconiux solani TaxID=661329 RepID=UPI000825BC9B|nr:acyltransferase [Herbiconiux solani]